MAEECGVERRQTPRTVRVARRFHLFQYPRVATNGALPEDDEAAGKNVRALHGDGDGHDLVAAPEEVVGAKANTFAAMHVHHVVRYLAAHLRDVVLQHG